MKEVFYSNMKVKFVDVDLGGALYHGHYLKYYDEARQELLIKLGHSFGDMIKSGEVFLVVDVDIKYIKPLLFEDTMHIYTRVKDHSSRTITFEQIIVSSEVDSAAKKSANFKDYENVINILNIILVAADLKKAKAITLPKYMKEIVNEYCPK